MPPLSLPPHLRGQTRANARTLQNQAKNLQTYTRRVGTIPNRVNIYGNNRTVSSRSNGSTYGNTSMYTGINNSAVVNQPFNNSIYRTANFALAPTFNPTFQRPSPFGHPNIREKYLLPQQGHKFLLPNRRTFKRKNRRNRRNN